MVIFKDGNWWIAQCLNYDIAALAGTLEDVLYEIQRMLVGRIIMAEKLGIDPFEGIPPAPKWYRDIIEGDGL